MIAVNRAAARKAHRDRLIRKLIYAAGTAFIVGFLATQSAGYAHVEPGPTPDLTVAVLEANDPATVDPSFGKRGRWLATTINAHPLSWVQYAQCQWTDTECDLYPLATGRAAKEGAASAMERSVTDAAQMATAWTGGTADFSPVMTADLGEVGGASAGTMMTLAFIDAATPGDLTGGKVIAGTGTINSLAEVGPVTGVGQKVAGAIEAGADVFITPHLRESEARAAAEGSDLVVVPASHLPDVLRWLCDNGGQSTVCDSPALTQDAAG